MKKAMSGHCRQGTYEVALSWILEMKKVAVIYGKGMETDNYAAFKITDT